MKYVLLLLALCASPLSACLWDTDTLAEESAGLPEVKVVIVGGFARNPDLYYEMRLERVSKLLKDDHNNLDAYDDAGVSCDRLGRDEEAIEWMAKKLKAMERMGYSASAQPNHRYRYLANLGTFHAHRWFHNGADRERLDDLTKARDLIAQALQENPDAHFGREKYQLMFIDWALSNPKYYTYDEQALAEAAGHRSGWVPNFLSIGDGDEHDVLFRTRDNAGLKNIGLEDAVAGISGLITLGAAWESVDAFYALALALQAEGKSAFAYFAMLRVEELLAEGRTSGVRDVPVDVFDSEDLTRMGYNLTKDAKATAIEFHELRQQSDRWQESRLNYMLPLLKEGRHPDTDNDFWGGFEGDPEHMEVPAGAIYGAGGAVNAVLQSDWFWILSIFLGGSFLLMLYYFYAKRRDRRLRRIHGAAKVPYP